jgi:hypothetical protein
MKIAYLVFAYRNPQLIKKMVEKLSSENSGFFLHIDAKSHLRDFTDIHGHNVFFPEQRIPVYWGEFSGVRAITLLIHQALERKENYDYFFLLSGSEYPIRSRQYIERYLEKNYGLEFIRLIKAPAPGKPLSRFSTVRYESDKPVRRLAFRALDKIGLAQRDYLKHLEGLEPYSGRTWWTLTRAACEFALQFAGRHPQIPKFFMDTFAPEESFFHTILGNSEFASRACGNLVYEDWSRGGAHPEMIDERHASLFESQSRVFDTYEGSSELLFARKFSDENLTLLPRIDRMAATKGDN